MFDEYEYDYDRIVDDSDDLLDEDYYEFDDNDNDPNEDNFREFDYYYHNLTDEIIEE